jgi:hypothetical protein
MMDDEETTPRSALRPMFRRDRPSWMAIAAMMLSVTVPVCGWMVSISNRIAALEVKTESLATTSQMAEVKQKIDDWIAESDRERVDERVREVREAK